MTSISSPATLGTTTTLGGLGGIGILLDDPLPRLNQARV